MLFFLSSGSLSSNVHTCDVCYWEEGRILAGRVPQFTKIIVTLVWYGHTRCGGIDGTERIVFGGYRHVADCQSEPTSDWLVHECLLCISGNTTLCLEIHNSRMLKIDDFPTFGKPTIPICKLFLTRPNLAAGMARDTELRIRCKLSYRRPGIKKKMCSYAIHTLVRLGRSSFGRHFGEARSFGFAEKSVEIPRKLTQK